MLTLENQFNRCGIFYYRRYLTPTVYLSLHIVLIQFTEVSTDKLTSSKDRAAIRKIKNLTYIILISQMALNWKKKNHQNSKGKVKVKAEKNHGQRIERLSGSIAIAT